MVVTSWSAAGEKLYGRRFRKGYKKHWGNQHGIKLNVRDDHLLLMDPEVVAFRRREHDKQTASGSPKWGALKWSWKVFAMTLEPMPTEGWMIWIDGDVEFIATPDAEFFDQVCPKGADVSFLGRPWAYASETGFVCFNMSNPPVHDLLRLMRATYMTSKFRPLTRKVERRGKPPKIVGNWGDAAVFDHCREFLGGALVENDLARDSKPGDLHVWPKTVLGPYMVHRKGPARKLKAYGGSV